MNDPYNVTKAFEEGLFSNQELLLLEAFIANHLKYQKLIERFLVNDWSWTRLDALERAILLFGAHELTINERATVISETVAFAKSFIPDDKAYKFINKVLDEIGGVYERIKSSNQNA